MITAKVKCTSKAERGEGDKRQAVVGFQPDYADSRNKEWALYTPALSLSMTLRGTVADRFEVDRPYTLQFVEDEPVPPRSAPNQQPTICRMVQYRGKEGLQALRAAVIAATVDTLDPRGVEAGDVPALDSPNHVHLVVFTPGESGHFTEYNVPLDEPGMCRPGTWQWPTRV
jgi:hypothetical protein